MTYFEFGGLPISQGGPILQGCFEMVIIFQELEIQAGNIGDNKRDCSAIPVSQLHLLGEAVEYLSQGCGLRCTGNAC